MFANDDAEVENRLNSKSKCTVILHYMNWCTPYNAYTPTNYKNETWMKDVCNRLWKSQICVDLQRWKLTSKYLYMQKAIVLLMKFEQCQKHNAHLLSPV